MRHTVVGWKNLARNGYFKAKLIFVCALASISLASLLFEHSKKTVKAAGQIQQPANEKWSPQITSFLFHGALAPVGSVPTDHEDEAHLREVLRMAHESYFTDGRNISNKQQLKRDIAVATTEALEQFIVDRPNSIWTPSVRNHLGT